MWLGEENRRPKSSNQFFVLCLDCFLDAKNSDDFFLTLVCFEYDLRKELFLEFACPPPNMRSFHGFLKPEDGIRADLPPDPQEVLWQDLAVSPDRQSILELCGYFVIFLIFWGFMPVVVFIQSIANLSTLEKDRYRRTDTDGYSRPM